MSTSHETVASTQDIESAEKHLRFSPQQGREIQPAKRSHIMVLGILSVIPFIAVGTAVMQRSPAIGIFAVLATFFVTLVYVSLVVRSNRTSPNTRALWALGLIILSPLVAPAFWWAHVRKGKPNLRARDRQASLRRSSHADARAV